MESDSGDEQLPLPPLEIGKSLEQSTTTGPECPSCGEPWLRGTNLPARYRCVYCLHRFELRSECPNCGAHSTIARMSDTANVICRNCGGSMLQPI
jgi:ribosomal protein S27E